MIRVKNPRGYLEKYPRLFANRSLLEGNERNLLEIPLSLFSVIVVTKRGSTCPSSFPTHEYARVREDKSKVRKYRWDQVFSGVDLAFLVSFEKNRSQINSLSFRFKISLRPTLWKAITVWKVGWCARQVDYSFHPSLGAKYYFDGRLLIDRTRIRR